MAWKRSSGMRSASRTPEISAPSFGVSLRTWKGKAWDAVAFMILRPRGIAHHEPRRRFALSRLRYYPFSLCVGRGLQAAAARSRYGGPVHGRPLTTPQLARAAGQPDERPPL